MAFPLQAIPQYPLAVQFESTKFFRRTDLTTEIRFTIAIKALYGQLNGVWGTVTQIAKEMDISRPFIYSLASSLKEASEFLFCQSMTSSVSSLSRDMAIQTMLSLRMEGGSSHNRISTMMKRFECELTSVGSITYR